MFRQALRQAQDKLSTRKEGNVPKKKSDPPKGTPTNGKDKVNVNNKAFMELRTPLVPFRHVPLFSEEGIKDSRLKQKQEQEQKLKAETKDRNRDNINCFVVLPSCVRGGAQSARGGVNNF